MGDLISSAGLADSVNSTIKKRVGKVYSLIDEIIAVVEDFMCNSLGGILVGLDLCELAVIPFLMNNSETWTEADKEAIAQLENIQNRFLRRLLATPWSTPTPSLCWETGTSTMINRIILKKLTFYHHLLHLDDNSLAKQIFNIEEKLSYPGLVKECRELMQELLVKSSGNLL